VIKILVVFGTRPEAIKLVPVIKELEKSCDKFIVQVCVTAQHRQMLDQVLELFDIQADYDLDVMKPGQDLYDVTANVLLGLRSVLEIAAPDLVLVHGDTTTTMAASLAAFYSCIPIGHIEAGLRTGNKRAPFPEEINRAITGRLADIHFAPTEQARQNLLAEGVPDDIIHITGNTVIDALFLALDKISYEALGYEIEKSLVLKNPSLCNIFPQLDSNQNVQALLHNSRETRLILVTGHRRENFGEGFENICLALKDIADNNPDMEIIYPVHLNPNVQEPVHRILSDCKTIHLIAPLDYLPFVFLMNRSYLIITDSGGVQEEAPSLGKPVLVLRETTERPEAVEAGTVALVGTDRIKIVNAAQKLLDDVHAYAAMSQSHNPYGDGNAAIKIVKILEGSVA
jgi:UDP-N-acetylglucosamine 2-epimerase (non-hydrolysing)